LILACSCITPPLSDEWERITKDRILPPARFQLRSQLGDALFERRILRSQLGDLVIALDAQCVLEALACYCVSLVGPHDLIPLPRKGS
jgi:hypothetical protein